MHRPGLRGGRSAAVLLLAAASCSRDLSIAGDSPPSVAGVYAPGHESGAPPAGGLPLLSGELAVILGAGFGTDAAQLRVAFGSAEATVLDVAPSRVVVRVPAGAGAGAVDVSVTTPGGFATLASGAQLLGPGAPPAAVAQSVATTTPVEELAPVVLSPTLAPLAGDPTFGSLAAAIGSSDSALLVAGGLDVAVAAVPLGIVPTTVAARLVPLPGFVAATGTGTVRLQIVAVDRAGTAALGGLDFTLSAWTLPKGNVAAPSGYPVVARNLAPSPGCDVPRVAFTARGSAAALLWRPAGAWQVGVLDPASLDPSLAATALRVKAGSTLTLGGPPVAWSALDDRYLAIARNAPGGAAPGELLQLDTGAATPTLSTLLASGTAVSSRLAACGGPGTLHGVATAGAVSSTPYPGGLVAAAFTPTAGAPQVATVDLATGATSCKLAGPGATALAFANAAVASPPSPDFLLAASLSNLARYSLASGSTSPDAALSLGSDSLAALPAFEALVPTAGGVRVLAIDEAGDLVTVLPATMTSLGPIYRLAPYGEVSVAVADVTGATEPVAIAEHTLLSAVAGGTVLDTAGAALVVPVGGTGAPFSLGAGTFARGAVWMSKPSVGSALAYAADGSAGPAATAAAFTKDLCTGDVRVSADWPLAGAEPSLVAVGPARAGALGPAGEDRFGPSPAPAYALFGTTLAVLSPDATTLTCLLDPTRSWSSCGSAASVELGVAALDVTLSAGDVTVAARHLDRSAPTCAACAGEALCERTVCDVASELVLAREGQPATTVALPGPPLSVAADRAGGFVASLACTSSAATTTASTCFPGSTVCAGPAFQVTSSGRAGALVWVPEDGGAPQCLAVHLGLAGRAAITPNGAEVWVAGSLPGSGSLDLTRVALARRTSDGAIDTSAPQAFEDRTSIGAAAAVSPGFAPSGVAFTSDGATGIVTVPAEYRLALFE